MPHATHSVTISRPADAVFAFVADGETAKQWRSGVLDIKRASGDGVGARYTQGVKGPMGRRIEADYEVTASEPGKRLEFQTIAGPVRPHGRFDLVPEGDATRLTFTLDVELSGIKKLLMGSSVQKSMDAEVNALKDLKRVLEA